MTPHLFRVAIVLALAASSSCTTIYSSPATISQDTGAYVFTAQKRLMLTGRSIYIFANDRKIMAAKARYWSKRITMTGHLDGKPIAAECDGSDSDNTCLVTMSGAPVASLKF